MERKGRGAATESPGEDRQLSLFDGQTARDQVERESLSRLDLWQEDERERERATLSIMEQIARSHALEENYAARVYQAAPRLAAEDAADLILGIARWVTDDLNRLAQQATAAASAAPARMQRLSRDLGFRRSKAETFLQRLWRLDRSMGSVRGILDIPTVPKMLAGARVTLDAEAAARRLRERIVGRRVIEIMAAPDNPHRAAAGTDASVGDISLDHQRGSFIPPTPASLFVSAAALKTRGGPDTLNYWDYDLDPRELRQYSDLDAAMDGRLISPHLRREAITDFRHLRSAAMELRQYSQELRVIQQQSRWRPVGDVPDMQRPPPVTLLIRDGRIFPLVHRLDDYDGASAPDDLLYGEVVRREIRAFQKVFHNTAGCGRLGAVYAAAVKSPEYSWLSMIVFWYLHARAGHHDLADAFYRPPLNDQAVAHLLFRGLAASQPEEVFGNPRNTLITFRALRRFSDIAFFPHPRPITDEAGRIARAVREDSLDDWLAYIQQHISEANQRYDLHKRGVPALTSAEEYGPFLDLCHRAGVAMFYAAPAGIYRSTLNDRSHLFTPRWEVAVDLTRNPHEAISRHVAGLMAWLAEKDALQPDSFHAVGGFEEAPEGLPLFVPDVVMEAHRAAGYGRDRHAIDAADELHALIRDIRGGRLSAAMA